MDIHIHGKPAYGRTILGRGLSLVTEGTTKIATPDIARPSNLWGVTSREWTTWYQLARVEIARLVWLFEYLIVAF